MIQNWFWNFFFVICLIIFFTICFRHYFVQLDLYLDHTPCIVILKFIDFVEYRFVSVRAEAYFWWFWI